MAWPGPGPGPAQERRAERHPQIHTPDPNRDPPDRFNPSIGRLRSAAASPARRSPSIRFYSIRCFPIQIPHARPFLPMASNAPPPQQPPAPQLPKPTRVSLSYEEISKLFSLPIAEAASILGVCTSVLKRICRTHGIVRWPYRKLVSGKAGDDTKTEKAKELIELSKVAKQKAFSSSGPSTMSSSGTPQGQGAAKPVQGSCKAGGQVPGAGRQNASSPSLSQTKGIPSYMDDFRYGFPSCGLSCETLKWWGSSSHSHSHSHSQADGSRESAAAAAAQDDELEWGADEGEGDGDGVVRAEASAQLCSLRRKAVDDGRKLLINGDGHSGRRGQQEFCRLSKRQKLVVAQVFGSKLAALDDAAC